MVDSINTLFFYPVYVCSMYFYAYQSIKLAKQHANIKTNYNEFIRVMHFRLLTFNARL